MDGWNGEERIARLGCSDVSPEVMMNSFEVVYFSV